MTKEIERYVAARQEMERLDALSDAAFARYFSKLQAGERTNGAASQRLSNQANYQSTEVFSAESALYDLDLDPEKVWEEYGHDQH